MICVLWRAILLEFSGILIGSGLDDLRDLALLIEQLRQLLPRYMKPIVGICLWVIDCSTLRLVRIHILCFAQGNCGVIEE